MILPTYFHKIDDTIPDTIELISSQTPWTPHTTLPSTSFGLDRSLLSCSHLFKLDLPFLAFQTCLGQPYLKLTTDK